MNASSRRREVRPVRNNGASEANLGDHSKDGTLNDVDQSHSNTHIECRYFRKNGRCKDGDRCLYSHNVRPEASSAAAAAAAALVQKVEHVSAHQGSNESHARLCRYFLRTGVCRQGDRCTFLHSFTHTHVNPDQDGGTYTHTHPPSSFKDTDTNITITLDETKKFTKLCRFYLNDECKLADKCPFIHSRHSTDSADYAEPNKHSQQPHEQQQQQPQQQKECRYFTRNGRCKLGSDCPFVHTATATSTGPVAAAPKPASAAAPATATATARAPTSASAPAAALSAALSVNGTPASVSASASGAGAGNGKAICKFFRRTGRCKLGQECNFLHVVDQASPPTTATATAAAAATERAAASASASVSATTALCKYFQRSGSCKLGSDCPFVHAGATSRGTNSSATATRAATAAAGGAGGAGARLHGAGTGTAPTSAPASASGQSSHAPASTAAVCRYFSRNGRCNNGSSCPYLHQGTDDNAAAVVPKRAPRSSGGGGGTHRDSTVDAQVRGKPRNRAELATILATHAVAYPPSSPNNNNNSNGNHPSAHSRPSRIVTDASVSVPFLENLLRNNSHKHGFLLEQHLCVIEADRLRVLDDYRTPLCVSAIGLLPTTSLTRSAASGPYVSMDKTFQCVYDNRDSAVGVTYSYTPAAPASARHLQQPSNTHVYTYTGSLPVPPGVSVPVDDLLATIALMHDFLFGYIMNAY